MPFSAGVVTLPADPTVQVSGSITQVDGVEVYRVTLDTEGELVADVHSPGIGALLSLEDDQGHVLIQGEAVSSTNTDARIAQHLPAGTYELSVASLDGLESFTLSTKFTLALDPSEMISEGQGSSGVTVADINGDGKPDIILADNYENQILVNMGVGDGTFQPPIAIPVGSGPTDVLAASLGGDGHVDLAVVDQSSNDVMILDGDGRGDFRVSQVLTTLPGPVKVVAGDFSGDGRLDLAVAISGSNGVEVFHNQGNGTFVEASWIGSIATPTALTVADLNGDGRADLAVASGGSGNLVLLVGQGNDQFVPMPYQLPVGPDCSDVISADLSGVGRPDLVAVSPDTGLVSIFHFDGFAYRSRGSLKAGSRPTALIAADFNGDGQVDLATTNFGSNNVSIFLGQGNDQFGAATTESTGSGPIDLASADLSGDGRTDLVTSDLIGLTVSVLINNGNATFHGSPSKPPSAGPETVVTADLNGDGNLDLVVPDAGLNEVSIFLGRGDGTFREPIDVPAGSGPEDVAVGDFDGDGKLDLAVVDSFSNSIMLLKGEGDGTFATMGTLATGDEPEFIKTADLDGDGHLDLVVADYLDNDVAVFYGRGDGTFSDAVKYPVGLAPSGIAIGDLNGDGRPDIAVSDSGSNDVDVLLATGLRSFAPALSFPAGAQPWEVSEGDFNGDGHPDLVVADGLSSPSSISLLTGVGNGTFLPPVSFGADGSPFPLVVGDLNGDGKLDVVTGNDDTNDLSVLLGRGNGTFANQLSLPTGIDPYGVALGDFNGDGHLDLVSVNFQSSDLTIYLGRGDGTFNGAETMPIESSDLPTITAQLEGNGVPDVIVANPQAGTITVSISQGDGTLQVSSTIDVGGSPSGLVVGDFNGDGRPDLAVTDASSGDVLILLGLGDGTFESPIRYKVGKSPRSPVIGDFNKDGILDIAVANTDSNTLSVLFGRGDGTFDPQVVYPVGLEPVSLLVRDVNGDGILDLGSVNRSSHDVSELIGLPGGKFYNVTTALPGITPSALVLGDFNGDGQPDLVIDDELAGRIYVALDFATDRTSPLSPVDVGVGKVLIASADLYHNGESDLVVANVDSGLVTILGGWSNDTFETRTTFVANVTIAGLSLVDLNRDGLPDILITEAGTGDVKTYLSAGGGVFSAAESTVPLPHSAPLVFPEPSPGVSSIINLTNDGSILARTGLDDAIAEFGPPVNETSKTGLSVRQLAVVQTGSFPDVAALDAQNPLIYVQRADDSDPAGVTILQLPNVGNYTRLISGDLFGTGLDDLVVINETRQEVIIFQQTSSGVFSQYGDPISTGFGPTDVTLSYLTPGALPDLVVTDGSSGDITLIARRGDGSFFAQATLPAGLAAASTVYVAGELTRTSPDEPVSVASGVFGPSGLTEVVVADRGTDRISILQGLPGGGLSAPDAASTYSTGLDPIQVVAAPLGRNGLLDLIVLNEGSDDISIFLNNGRGGFVSLPRVDAGDDPTSLTVSDVTGDGLPDLVVSNANGDILILNGNGNGTFQPYQRADDTVNLAVGDLAGNGQNEFVLSNTSKDLLTVQTSNSAVGFLQGRGDGLLAPGPVAIADLNDDGIPDLIVTNTGGNDVFVYLGLGKGLFATPQRFFTGTAPIGLTVAALTKNGLPDLVVANSGSNDVTILLGIETPGGGWTMVPGPRLKAGDQPVSTTVADVYGDGNPDILVVDQEGDTLTVLRGLGGGFFDDTDPQVLATGLSPVQAFVGHFSSSTEPGIVILNSLSNDMTYYANINQSAATISTGGIGPVAGVVGDFNNDGFSDLAIANSGDSRITLFDGGSFGLSLIQAVSLGTSTHPTDLVVSGTMGGLQFFVVAEGQDHAIAVNFSPDGMGESSDLPPTPGNPVNSGGIIRFTTDSLTNTNGLNAAFFEATANASIVQGQESVQAGSQAGAVTGAFGLVAAMGTTILQATQPLFSPSLRTLGSLLESLGELAQGQFAEILPLGKDEMAAVAVLLSASNIANPLGEVRGLLPTEEDQPLVAGYISEDHGKPANSPLDRFIARLGVAAVDLPRDLVTRTGRVPEYGPDWVWHRRSGAEDSITASFEERREIGLATHQATEGADIAIEADPELVALGTDEAGFAAERESSSILWFAAKLAALVVATTVGLLIRSRLDGEVLSKLLNRRGKDLPREPIEGRDRVGPHWSSSRTRTPKDLPPWLHGPTSTHH